MSRYGQSILEEARGQRQALRGRGQFGAGQDVGQLAEATMPRLGMFGDKPIRNARSVIPTISVDLGCSALDRYFTLLTA
jgi:hypothetical protein